MFVHELGGCAPYPLAHYLKALGILRLLDEQLEPRGAPPRGWWAGSRFKLAVDRSRDQLKDFFLEHYKPTPIFNPWGGRSGFYPGSSETRAREALEKIKKSDDKRFEKFKIVIDLIREIIKDTGGEKPENKEEFIKKLRQNIRGGSSLWIDAVSAVVDGGENLKVFFPPCLELEVTKGA